MIDKVLVAIDGSESSRRAAQVAAELATAARAKLIVLTVLEQPAMLPLAPLDSFALVRTESDEEVARVRRMLDEVAAQLPVDQVEKRVELGSPAEVILKQAGEDGVDLIVLGRRGHGALERLVLGSVSERVLRHARVPVTVVN